MFLKKSDAEKAKSLADKFRISQAFVTSVPLLLLNVITLINALKVPGKDVLDISYLSTHLNEGMYCMQYTLLALYKSLRFSPHALILSLYFSPNAWISIHDVFHQSFESISTLQRTGNIYTVVRFS